MLLAGLGSVRIGKNCDLGLENAARRGRRPRAAFSRPRSQFFPIRTSQPANNIYVCHSGLYGLGYPRQPSPRATLAEVTFSLFLSKIQPAVYIRIANSSRGARQLGWVSCLTSTGRVTLASGTTFLHINALARLTGTSLGVANVT